jgi:hypothetical protein
LPGTGGPHLEFFPHGRLAGKLIVWGLVLYPFKECPVDSVRELAPTTVVCVEESRAALLVVLLT